MRRFTAVLVLALVACAIGQDYILKSCVIDEGGSQTASSNYIARLSFGQPIASNGITSTGFHAILGFWHPDFFVGVREPVVNSVTTRLVFALGQSVPNPFSSRAVINYCLPAEVEVELKVFGRDGRVVTTLVGGRQQAGRYRVTWDLDSRTRARLANGVYFCRLTAGENIATRKMVKME